MSLYVEDSYRLDLEKLIFCGDEMENSLEVSYT